MAICLLLTICLTTIGCVERRVVRDTWGGLREMSDNKPASNTSRDSDRPTTSDLLEPPSSARQSFSFAIPLASFDGETQQPDADAYMRMLRREYNLPDLWSRREKDKTTVYRGQFEQANDKTATSALRQVRMLRVNGEQPFRNTEITRVSMAQRVELEEMNLKRYASRGFYSLQVEVYDDAIGNEYQTYAEDRAMVLRGQGEPAFYYHGPHRSMVLIGLMTEDEAFVPQIGGAARYSQRVRDIQERFPHNLMNGHTVVEKSGGQRIGEQPSFLVPVN